jgi:hypothetical protein
LGLSPCFSKEVDFPYRESADLFAGPAPLAGLFGAPLDLSSRLFPGLFNAIILRGVIASIGAKLTRKINIVGKKLQLFRSVQKQRLTYFKHGF